FPVHLSCGSIYTLPLHDALPISTGGGVAVLQRRQAGRGRPGASGPAPALACRVRRSGAAPARLAAIAWSPRDGAVDRCAQRIMRSEEHTSELQSRENLVCRLLHE